MATNSGVIDYDWYDEIPHTAAFLYEPLRELLTEAVPVDESFCLGSSPRVLDLGCGNGALVQQLMSWGYQPIGVDPSVSGINSAQRRMPSGLFYHALADPASISTLNLQPFDAVVSTEVVEHVYSPRLWASAAFASLKPGGVLICSTPYHGYIKNLALALSGKLDSHFTALWEGGHIKFWSRRTLTSLLEDAGFRVVSFRGAGRIRWLWMSMLLVARKPLE